MNDVMVFPDVRSAVCSLLEESEHFDTSTNALVAVRAVTDLPVDSKGLIDAPGPLAHIKVAGGTRGFVDRVDRLTIDMYAPEYGQAIAVLESVHAFLCRHGIDTPYGYLDSIAPDVTPAEVPFQDARLNQATATFLVTSRPLE